MLNPLDLSGRTVLVTGASSGIGRDTALLLSQLGARIVLAGRDFGRLAETLSTLVGEPSPVEAFDLSDAERIPV